MYADKRKYEMPYICFQCWALRVLNVPPFLVCSLKLVQFNSWDFYLLYSLCVFRICYSEVLWLWFLRNIPLESAVCSPAEDVSWRGTVFTQRKTIVRNTCRCFWNSLKWMTQSIFAGEIRQQSFFFSFSFAPVSPQPSHTKLDYSETEPYQTICPLRAPLNVLLGIASCRKGCILHVLWHY